MVARDRVLLLLLFIALPTQGQIGRLSSVALSGEPRPGGGNFQFDNPFPVVRRGVVAFRGEGADLRVNTGLYTSRLGQPVQRVVDEASPVPTLGGTFQYARQPHWLESGELIFFGLSTTGDSGLFSYANGASSLLAGPETPRPQGGIGLQGFGIIEVRGESVVFLAAEVEDFNRFGLYRLDENGLALVASTDTDVPDDGTRFSAFNRPAIGNEIVAFRGWNSSSPRQRGIYSYEAGALSTIADFSTSVPGTSSTFIDLGSEVDVRDGSVLFSGTYLNGTFPHVGLFEWQNGATRAVVDGLTPIGPGGERFVSISRVHAVGEVVVLFARTTFRQGLFLVENGVVSPIVTLGDVLDGREITRIRHDFDGANLALALLSTSFSTSDTVAGIYLLPIGAQPVPGLSGLSVLLMSVLLGLVSTRILRSS